MQSCVSHKLLKVWVFLAFVVVSMSASAYDWKTFVTGQKYEYVPFVGAEYKYTPEADGVLKIYGQADKVSVYSKGDDENGIITGEYQGEDWISNELSNFKSFGKTIDGVAYSSYTETIVKAGVTYYVLDPGPMSSGKCFYGELEQSSTSLTLVRQNYESGQVYDINDKRYGQLNLEFSMHADADKWAYLKVGNYPEDKEKGKVEVHTSTNNGMLFVGLKDSLMSWLDKGYIVGGEEMTLTITGIHATADNSIVYGEDGTLVLKFIAPGKGHKLVSKVLPNPLYSYYAEGDKEGIAVLTFDADVMAGEEQTAKVSLLMGSADMGDVYQEFLDPKKITVDGNNLYIDFTGKLRTLKAMGLVNTFWNSMKFTITNVRMADGTYASTDGVHAGTYSYTLNYEERNFSELAPDFTPENGGSLADVNELKAYFSKKDAFSFTGVRFTYQDANDKCYQVDVKDGITSEPVGKEAIEYSISLTDAIKAGKNVRLSFLDLVCTDGLNHDDLTKDVKFNPGDELTADFNFTSTNIKEGAVVKKADKLVFTFDEAAYVLEGDNQATIKDITTGKQLSLKSIKRVEKDGKFMVQVVGNEKFQNARKYAFTVYEKVIGDKQFYNTSGKYGKYMPETTITFTVNENKGKLDFVVDPLEGSVLNKIDVITCKTDKSRDIYDYALAWGNDRSKEVWACIINGTDTTKVSKANIEPCEDNDGFTLTFDPAITEPGDYTIVMSDSVYFIGEGFVAAPNEQKVCFSYKVIAAPQATIKLDSNPASDSTVEALPSITLTADQPLYVKPTTVRAVCLANRASVDGTLSVNPLNDHQAVIFFDDVIEEEGDYTIDIPEGIVGDKAWYDADFLSGVTNEMTTIYITVKNNGGQEPGELRYECDPADGSKVESLSTITITFPDYDEVGIGDGKVTVKRDGEEIKRIDAEFGVEFNQLVINFDATESGVYTFEFSEGYVVDAGGEGLPAFTLTYTIGTATGIEGVNADTDSNVKAFSIDGRRVDVKTAKGIVIVNGKKVLKK